jgi:hypothetical protein
MSGTAELAKVEAGPGRALIVAESLTFEAEQRRLLGQYVKQQMVEGTDYGVIPGTTNKALLKPGAEKLVGLFRCAPRFTIEEKIEDWAKGLFFYRFSCQIVTLADGAVVAEGVGSCTSYESRYRWRNADRKCPNCGKEAIKRSKYPPKDDPQAKPGWYCFGKVGGCGANFAADDASITGQTVGRVENPDLVDSANTVLKMAKKRALVDASIALARCSDTFTQDVEDQPGADDGRRDADANAGRPQEQARDPDPVNNADDMQSLCRRKQGDHGWATVMKWLQKAYPDAGYKDAASLGHFRTLWPGIPQGHREKVVAAVAGMKDKGDA